MSGLYVQIAREWAPHDEKETSLRRLCRERTGDMMRYYRGVNGVIWRVTNGDVSTAVVWDFNAPQRWKRIKADPEILSGEEIPEGDIPRNMK